MKSCSKKCHCNLIVRDYSLGQTEILFVPVLCADYQTVQVEAFLNRSS